ncbi:hypothetical protein LTR08_001445 [Meristemomyces frigidus]|nr:hypothetical protein LTR08_001445 [Meristemomyces frigidus]
MPSRQATKTEKASKAAKANSQEQALAHRASGAHTRGYKKALLERKVVEMVQRWKLGEGKYSSKRLLKPNTAPLKKLALRAARKVTLKRNDEAILQRCCKSGQGRSGSKGKKLLAPNTGPLKSRAIRALRSRKADETK